MKRKRSSLSNLAPQLPPPVLYAHPPPALAPVNAEFPYEPYGVYEGDGEVLGEQSPFEEDDEPAPHDEPDQPGYASFFAQTGGDEPVALQGASLPCCQSVPELIDHAEPQGEQYDGDSMQVDVDPALLALGFGSGSVSAPAPVPQFALDPALA
jgi:hypothetical protein